MKKQTDRAGLNSSLIRKPIQRWAPLFILPVSTAGNMLCQSIGKAKEASFLASTRSGLFYIPVMILASQTAGLAGIQAAQVIADLLAVGVTIPILLRVFREFPQEAEPGSE